MTMGAEVLPVRAIGRVVVMIAVLVMDSQQVEAGRIKLAAAFGADRAMDLQRFSPVVGVIVHLAAHLFDKSRRLFGGRE